MAAKATLLSVIPAALGNNNGLAELPPMGWRSWNLYGNAVTQELIEGVMDGMVSKKRSVDGVPTSLCDLGYCDVGLDDNWQDCKSGTGGNHYHDSDGNPLINYDRFPDMKKMVDHAHGLGLTAGWYGNNCMCSDQNTSERKFYEGDAKALRKFGFDGYKLDGCGAQNDMQLWDDVFKADKGPAVMVENCHWGSQVPYEPTRDWCPWNFYRTSGDVRASYSSVMGNLNTVAKFSSRNLSYPGCWAYPDMLEVGCQHGPGGADDPGLSMAETRSHYASWVIVSSPLTLGLDVNNDTIMDQVWPIISNREILAVSQSYFGFSGGPFQSSATRVQLDSVNHAARTKHMSEEELAVKGPTVTASQQFLYKPQSWDGSKTAVLLMNSGDGKQDLTLKLSDVPGMTGPCDVRDLWEHKDMGNHADTVTVTVESHDAAFLLLSGCTSAPSPPPPVQTSVVNPASGKCLDIYNKNFDDHFEDESKVQIFDCNGGNNQVWMLLNGALMNPESGMCLDIYNHDGLSPDQYKDETKVELYHCNGNPNQQWAFQDGQLVNTPSGKCLDIYSPNGELEDETPVQLFSCAAGKANQGWTMDQSLMV